MTDDIHESTTAETHSTILVREEDTGSFGLYHPDENVIETYIGNDHEEIHGEYYGENWHDAEIEEQREDIADLRARELTDEQERELERLELRLESQENVLELAKEVDDE